ncbi:MAG: DNA polymerase III subunit delta' [Proteobacteria bacterium]|nr:DNA polymerase III subunit delta' [Pseudomonadota bacterium]MBU0967142.1 DNA polymerase III subunit delta' [Pseudomonadota bacterium]
MLISFQSVIGQPKAKQFLTGSFQRQKTAHAYLFRGPAGVGKKTCALAFAALINCLAPVNGDVCGRCSSCLKYHSGNHPDLLKIEPQGTTSALKIDQIRELKKTLIYPPFEARFRVVLIQDIHLTMRRKEVTNSLLKTLEEPPADTVFILTGDEAGDILPTILSRCQIVPFYSLPYEQVTQALMIHDHIEEQTAASLAAISEGSLGRARLLYQEKLLPLRREIIESILALAPGTPDAVQAVFQLAEKAGDTKDNLDELLDLITSWIRDIMLAHRGLSDRIINSDLRSLLPAACHRWDHEELSDKLQRISLARRQLLHNCNRTLVCEVLFFGLL